MKDYFYNDFVNGGFWDAQPFIRERCNIVLVCFQKRHEFAKTAGKRPLVDCANDFYSRQIPSSENSIYIDYFEEQIAANSTKNKVISGIALVNKFDNVISLDFDPIIDDDKQPVSIDLAFIKEFCYELLNDADYPFIESTPKNGFHVFIKCHFTSEFTSNCKGVITFDPIDITKCKQLEWRLNDFITVVSPSISPQILGGKYNWIAPDRIHNTRIITVEQEDLFRATSKYFDVAGKIPMFSGSQPQLHEKKAYKKLKATNSEQNRQVKKAKSIRKCNQDVLHFEGTPMTSRQSRLVKRYLSEIEKQKPFELDYYFWKRIAFGFFSCGYEAGLPLFIKFSLNDKYPEDDAESLTLEFQTLGTDFLANHGERSESKSEASPKSLIKNLKYLIKINKSGD